MTTSDLTGFQPMPDLQPDQYAALRDSIAEHGISVPITVDQHGRIIDGNNRAAIAAELGIDCPKIVVQVADDDHAHDLAVELNCARRHLTQEQKRNLVRAELVRRWADSDRAIARRVGCSPSTVGGVRSCVRQDLKAWVRTANECFEKARDVLVMQAVQMHRGYQYERCYHWQETGDLLERLWQRETPGLSNLDTENNELDQWIADLAGGWFDSIRSWVFDCDEDCPTCTDEDREWARQHPKQVWRNGDVPVQFGQPAEAGGSR